MREFVRAGVQEVVTFDELYDSVEALDPSISRTSMFGMKVLKIQGKVFAGEAAGGVAFKLDAADLEQALALPGAKRFAPMAGREMKQWIELPEGQDGEWLRLAELAKAYALSRLKPS